MKICCLVMSVVSAVITGGLWAYPEPAVVPGPNDWTLEVVFDQPRQITIDNLEGGQDRLWYIILTLTNTADSDVPFYPSCELMTDTFRIRPAIGVEKTVFERIKRIHQGSFPFLEQICFAGNKILQGHDNTKDILVVWPDFETDAKNVTLFIGGLSNETVVIDHPADVDESGEPVKVYLRKTLALEYSIGGDPKFRASSALKFSDKHWVMR